MHWQRLTALSPPLAHFTRDGYIYIFVFNMDHFLKSLLNSLQYYFYFMFCDFFFGPEAYGIALTPPMLESEVLITGPPGSPEMVNYCVDIIGW